MIELEKIQRVHRLLATSEHSQRAIALLAGVSRATVRQVARGLFDERIASITDEDLEPELDEPQRPYVRCPTCGGRVWMPCVLCQMAARRERDRRRARLKQWLATPDGQRESVGPVGARRRRLGRTSGTVHAARRQPIEWPRRHEATLVDTEDDVTESGRAATPRDDGPRDDAPRDGESPRRALQPSPRLPAPGCSARALD